MKRVLFICTGNTCRSPMAELILKDKLKKRGIRTVRVSSAGIHATLGQRISENAGRALGEIGIRSGRFRSRQLTAEMLSEQNLLLVMTRSHKEALPETRNLFTIGEFTGMADIEDPYGGDLADYVRTRIRLEEACERVLSTIL